MPLTVTDPEVLSSAPPLRVRLPFTVKGLVPLVREPALTVKLAAVSCDSSLNVPEMDRAAKDWPAASVIVFPVPVRLTVDEVDVNPVAEEVFQEPPTLTVAEAKVMVAAPEEVRFPLNVGIEEVSVRVPANVRLLANVVEMPALTVRLLTVWVTLILPPELPTTIVEEPTAKEPALLSIDRTVIVEPFVVRAPPAATVRDTVVIGRFDKEVDRVVVPAPP